MGQSIKSEHYKLGWASESPDNILVLIPNECSPDDDKYSVYWGGHWVQDRLSETLNYTREDSEKQNKYPGEKMWYTLQDRKPKQVAMLGDAALGDPNFTRPNSR